MPAMAKQIGRQTFLSGRKDSDKFLCFIENYNNFLKIMQKIDCYILNKQKFFFYGIIIDYS